MKQKLHFLLLLFCITGVISCHSRDAASSEKSGSGLVNGRQGANVIVLCDVSPSISNIHTPDSAMYKRHIADMIGQCQDISRHYPPGSHINYYLISSNAFEKPFVHYDAPEVYQTDKQKVLDDLHAQDTVIARFLDSASKNPENRTCILTSIENAYNTFAASHEGVAMHNDLIIFSDMLEQCESTPVGRVMMHRNPKVAFLDSNEARKLFQYHGSPGWADLQVNIKIIMTTPSMESKVAQELKETWIQVFRNIGSEQAKNGSLFFESSPVFNALTDYKE
ncbi:MAG TPA: hypothetical protein VHB54_16730 [Mucilaginibacter sp.]|nr:hypothetical protein [Mucilaginibacter sp.]